MLIPWCTADYRLSFCKKKAKELRASGEFRRVVVRKKADEYCYGSNRQGKVQIRRIVFPGGFFNHLVNDLYSLTPAQDL